MLDSFEILTTSGVVLWSKHYTPVSSNIINSLITDVLIEERLPGGKAGLEKQNGRNPPFKKEKYTLKWNAAKDIGLIFVAVYQSLLSLSWVDNLLEVVRGIFLKQFDGDLKRAGRAHTDYSKFTPTFDALVAKLDKGSHDESRPSESDTASETQLTPPSSSGGTEDDGNDVPAPPVPGAKRLVPRAVVTEASSAEATPVVTPETSRPSSPAVSHLLTAKGGPGGKLSRRAKKSLNTSAPTSSGDESSASRRSLGARKVSAKTKRRWDDNGMAVDGDHDETLDYSAQNADTNTTDDESFQVDDVRADQMGTRTGKGQFVLKDLDDEIDAIISESGRSRTAHDETAKASPGLFGSGVGAISGYFKNIVGGKTLSKEDLKKPLKDLEDHLLRKNVAREAAVRLCESVERDLVGTKTANFTTIDATLRASLSTALTRMLTPTTSLDLLRAINTTVNNPTAPRPYVISIVGVNGVGKSTNLSKLAYFLLQNSYRVLVVAADTFRSGAVEQLRVHVRNLSELSRREAGAGEISLFEKGYGKDAAVIARDAVTFASTSGTAGGKPAFDVVLIDTAGRRHNDTRLMSSLAKFGQLADPDKIFMVGEALVGTDSVAQARNFSAQFVDAKGRGRGLDGFIISKCDTVGDMVGTLVSMVHATGIPVVFLGVGQHYGDLRGLNVSWAVDKLMR